jgi:hypothetical protein
MAKKIDKRLGGPIEPKVTRKIIEEEYLDDVKEASARAQKAEAVMIEMTSVQLKEFTTWIGARISAAYNSNVWKETWQRCLRMREYYERGVPRTDIKLENAHDYRSMSASAMADGMRSRLITLYMEEPIIRIEGRNAQGRRNAPEAEMFMNYHNTKIIELPIKGDMTTGYLSVEGHAVWYSPWVFELDENHIDMIERRKYVHPETQEIRWVDLDSQLDTQSAAQEGFRPIVPDEYEVMETKRPEVKKNHPDLQVLSLIDYINPSDSKPGVPLQWEGVRQYFTLNQLLQLDDKKQLYKGSLDKVRKYLQGSRNEGEMDTRRESYDVNNVVTSDIDTQMPEKDTLDAIVGCWVIWGLMKVPGYKYLRHGMCLYHKQSDTVLHSRFNPYIGDPSPVFHQRLISVPWRFSGIGVMELASPGEQALNDLSNYVLDDGLILNGIPFKYNRKRLPNGISPFEIWKGVGVDRMSDIQELNVRDRRGMDMSVAQFTRGNTERRVGIGDLQLGRESDVTGKQPPTARGVTSVIREGQVRFNLLNFSMIDSMLKWAEYVMLLYQQLGPRKLVAEILDDNGNDLFPDGIPKRKLLGSFRFVPNVSAQGMIRELDAELNMMLYDRFQDNKLITDDVKAYYDMTMDVIKSSGKKNIWLQPLSVYQKAQGFATPSQFETTLSPDEKDLANALAAGGMDSQQIEAEIKILRGDAEPISKKEAGIK